MKTLTLISLLVMSICFGCTNIRPGQDPLIVNAERVETIALATFDLVLSMDNSNRNFWTTNMPAFHQFADWLRTPITPGNVSTRRGLLLISDLNNVKLDYKAARASSNTLAIAVSTLQGTIDKASQWLSVTTNSPAH